MGDVYMFADETGNLDWGLQVADYGLRAVQRRLERGDNKYMTAVQPTLRSEFLPWGNARLWPTIPLSTGRSPLDFVLSACSQPSRRAVATT